MTAEVEYNGDQASSMTSPSSTTQNATLAAGAGRSEWTGNSKMEQMGFPGAEDNGAGRSEWSGNSKMEQMEQMDFPGAEHNGAGRSKASEDSPSAEHNGDHEEHHETWSEHNGAGRSKASGNSPSAEHNEDGQEDVAHRQEFFMLLFGLSAVVVLLVVMLLTAVGCRCMKRNKDVPFKTEELETVPGVVVTVVGASPSLSPQDDPAAAAADEADLKEAQPDELCSTTSTAAPSELLETRSEVSACVA